MQLNYSFVNLVPFTVKNTTTKNRVLFQVDLTCNWQVTTIWAHRVHISKSDPHTPTGPIGLKKKQKTYMSKAKGYIHPLHTVCIQDCVESS